MQPARCGDLRGHALLPRRYHPACRHHHGAGRLCGPQPQVPTNGGGSGYMFRLATVQDFSAVTAACLLVRTAVFDAVHGLDEKLTVAYNDVDFCLRVRGRGLAHRLDAPTRNCTIMRASPAARMRRTPPSRRGSPPSTTGFTPSTAKRNVLHDPLLQPRALAGLRGLPRKRRPAPPEINLKRPRLPVRFRQAGPLCVLLHRGLQLGCAARQFFGGQRGGGPRQGWSSRSRATASISLMRFSWLTRVALGS